MSPLKRKPRVADMFCGAGGLSEGFRQAGCAVVAGSDSDPDACATYAHNFPEASVLCGDIRKADVRRVFLSAAGPDLDVLIGGPPCQAFSQVRNHARLIDDPRNSLYREFVRVIADVEPRAFVMENVPGLEQMGVREQVLEDLAIDGIYNVSAQVLDAADFGVPQTRQRIIFVGLHASLGIESPVITGSGATSCYSLRRRTIGRGIRYEVQEVRGLFRGDLRLADATDRTCVTAQQAIEDLEFLDVGRREDSVAAELLPPATSAFQQEMRLAPGERLTNVSVPRLNEDTKLRLRGVPEGGNFRDLSEKLLQRYLTGNRWGPSNGTGRLGRKHFYAYRRLHSAMWSWTLNTKADSVYHYRKLRALSVREFARLQSFPDRFSFVTDSRPGALPGRIDGGAAHSKYRQVGNAVPPLLGRSIAQALIGRLSSQKPVQRTA